jgi:preprotein translocase subunit SecB
MATKKKNTQHQPVAVDVSNEDTHASVQCEDIRLISSMLKPIIAKKDADNLPGFTFRIRALVEGKKAYSYLEVLINQFITGHPSKLTGFELSYVLMGTFISHQNMRPEDLGDFVKFYSLTILWPYAREYATDVFRRTGTTEVVLPIINPQVVTELIVENNLVEVEIVEKKKPKNS